MSDTYKCAMCGGTFEKIISEEAAESELRSYFGNVPVDECEVVCDDCWQKIKPPGMIA